MTASGTRVLDPIADTRQVAWVVLPVHRCPNESAEATIVRTVFRKPHECWPDGAFVSPVYIRRGRTRVLFRQESGVAL